jgi:tetratricopeptide (TPR) repeat protein
MSTSSWNLGCLCVVLLIGLVAAADVPFVFHNNFSSIINYTSSQLEDISKRGPEIANVPPIHTSSNNETIINISGMNTNNTNYLLPPDYSINLGPVSSIGQDWYKYGNEYYDEGDYNKSIECYEKTIQENPRFVDAWYNKGTALCKLGRYEDAVKAFDKALEINPNYANARENRDAARKAIRQ